MLKAFTTNIYVLLLCIMLSLFAQAVHGQPSPKPEKVLVQVSGIISGADTKTPLPFSTIRIKHSFRGTISGVDGFYSMVAAEKDTLVYQAFGHKPVNFTVPTGTKDQKYNYNITLQADTFLIDLGKDTFLPSYGEFRVAFAQLKNTDTYADLAKKNLDQEKLAELYETLARDGQENSMITLQQIANSYYYAGGQKNYMVMGGTPIPTSLLNPFAWAQLVKDIKAGKYKKKKKKDD